MHKKPPHRYSAYGINIASELELCELSRGRGSSADAEIRICKIRKTDISQHIDGGHYFERPGATVCASGNAMFISWDRVGSFLIHSGNEVMVDPDDGCDNEDLQPFVTGPVLSALLHQRGLCVLHASAVLISGRVAVFLGAKGFGKSTLAAQFQARGHNLVSDDIVPVAFKGDVASTYPGFPRIKLYEDSIVAVGGDPEEFPLVHKFVEKRSYNRIEGLPSAALQLHGVYVLAEGDSVSLEALGPASAFIELATHSFLNRYLQAMDCLETHFQQCESLVRTVPMWRLRRPHDFAYMDEVCSLIESNVRASENA